MKLSPLEIRNRLRPLAAALRPADERRRLDQLDRVLTREGRVRADTLSGFVPYQAVAVTADLPAGIDAALIGDGSVSNAEFGYLAGLTSDAQTQLDGKLSLASGGTVAGAVVFDGDVTIGNAQSDALVIGAHIRVTGTKPTLTATPVGTYPAAGTGPSGLSVAAGNDTSMDATIVTGTGPAAGNLLTVTFATARPNATYDVYLQPHTSAAVAAGIFPTNRSTAGFDVHCATAPGAGQTLSAHILVIGAS